MSFEPVLSGVPSSVADSRCRETQTDVLIDEALVPAVAILCSGLEGPQLNADAMPLGAISRSDVSSEALTDKAVASPVDNPTGRRKRRYPQLQSGRADFVRPAWDARLLAINERAERFGP